MYSTSDHSHVCLRLASNDSATCSWLGFADVAGVCIQNVLPLPCTREFVEEVRTWEATPEDENEEEMKAQYYGTTSGPIQGQVCAWPLTT